MGGRLGWSPGTVGCSSEKLHTKYCPCIQPMRDLRMLGCVLSWLQQSQCTRWYHPKVLLSILFHTGIGHRFFSRYDVQTETRGICDQKNRHLFERFHKELRQKDPAKIGIKE